jgi:hypothetical protein
LENYSHTSLTHLIAITEYSLIKEAKGYDIPCIYDGKPGLIDFLADVAQSHLRTCHGPRGLYNALWEDGIKKRQSTLIDKIAQLIGIELPEKDFQILKDEDKDQIWAKDETSKRKIDELIKTFKDKCYNHGASYLENLSERLFTSNEIWLITGIIAPKTITL